MANLSLLPTELLLDIFSYLPYLPLKVTLPSVCRRLRSVIHLNADDARLSATLFRRQSTVDDDAYTTSVHSPSTWFCLSIHPFVSASLKSYTSRSSTTDVFDPYIPPSISTELAFDFSSAELYSPYLRSSGDNICAAYAYARRDEVTETPTGLDQLKELTVEEVVHGLRRLSRYTLSRWCDMRQGWRDASEIRLFYTGPETGVSYYYLDGWLKEVEKGPVKSVGLVRTAPEAMRGKYLVW